MVGRIMIERIIVFVNKLCFVLFDLNWVINGINIVRFMNL